MIYTRITFNTNGWQQPSGRNGKAPYGTTHEAQYGFGYEEWLFNPRNQLIPSDGNVYGYLEGINKNFRQEDQDQILELFTINCNIHQRYRVARINSWQYVDWQESLNLIQNNPALVPQMQQELNVLGNEALVAINRFIQNVGNQHNPQVFNLKFKLLDVEFFGNQIYPPQHVVYNYNRYQLHRVI